MDGGDTPVGGEITSPRTSIPLQRFPITKYDSDLHGMISPVKPKIGIEGNLGASDPILEFETN